MSFEFEGDQESEATFFEAPYYLTFRIQNLKRRSPHRLEFETAQDPVSQYVMEKMKNGRSSSEKAFADFRIGKCRGQWRTKDNFIELQGIYPASHQHMFDVFYLFESLAKNVGMLVKVRFAVYGESEKFLTRRGYLKIDLHFLQSK